MSVGRGKSVGGRLTDLLRHALVAAQKRLPALPPPLPGGVQILAYHLVAAGTDSKVDVPRAEFRAQMEGLARRGGVLSLDQAVAHLHGPAGARDGDPGPGPRVVLTFDDAYSNFLTEAWPLLRDLGLPATLYVPTAFLDGGPAPMEAAKHLPPTAWEALAAARDEAGGNLTLGSHSHTHAELPGLDPTAIADDLERSQELLRQRTGSRGEHFCYPRALWNRQTEAVVRRFHRTSAVAGGRVNRPGEAEPDGHLRLHRIPVRRGLGPSLDPLLRHRLWWEEYWADRARRRRTASGAAREGQP